MVVGLGVLAAIFVFMVVKITIKVSAAILTGLVEGLHEPEMRRRTSSLASFAPLACLSGALGANSRISLSVY